MSTRLSLLEILNKNKSTYISGQELADQLGISRNSVWKAIKKLQEQGYQIDSRPATGYRLVSSGDVLSPDYIKENIPYPCRVHVVEKTDSTNNLAKTIADCSTPQIIVANEQTGGRGRLGRTFHSPAGAGLYMTVAFQPDFGLDRAMLTTAMSAVAAARAIERVTGLNPKIKWVNDIYLDGKKVCGILTEAESNFETGRIEKIIVGIGVNCFEASMPEDLNDIATYLAGPQKEFSRNELAAAIACEFFDMLENFDKFSMLREYKSRSFILGEQIMIFNPAIARSIGRPENRLSEGIRARAIDIDENGGLVIEFLEGRRSREMETLTTGEITVRRAYD
ncbi:MAG: biotin--[Firmicutes bacterium]|nr:biotin--[acetyl-CoA-carboxylase] ligase [Bacillota bacterium]